MLSRSHSRRHLLLCLFILWASTPSPAAPSAAADDPTNFAAEELRAMEDFYNSQAPAEQVAYWKTLMPVPKDSAKARRDALKGIPNSWLKHRVKDPSIVESIQAIIRPATELYGKNYEIIVIQYNKPVILVDSDAVMVITTELLQQLKSDDELLFLVAHEIAHSIFNEKSVAIKSALRDKTEPSLIHALAVIELSCDAIAARTLLHLGRATLSFADLSDRIDRSYEHEKVNYHPSAALRRSFVESIASCPAIKARQSDSLKNIKSALYLASN